ncbi:hypothetical protein M8037_17825, partial [Sinorhizobium meliloti]|uniref:hypothetical protein n=1 Tax=Rhizobium meliloti TaxID=382 RepID=UPI0020747CB4
IRARLMASDELVLLKPQQIDAETGKAKQPAVFTTREMLRIEYAMARSAEVLSRRKGFGVSNARAAAAVRSIETADTEKPFRL